MNWFEKSAQNAWEFRSEDVRENPNYQDVLFRWDTGRDPKYPFFFNDFFSLNCHDSYGCSLNTTHGVLFKNAKQFNTMADACVYFLGKDLYPKERGKPGAYGDNEKLIFQVDEMIGDEAVKQGYDALIFVKQGEVMALDKTKLGPLMSARLEDDRGDYGPDLVDGVGHYESVKRALENGLPVPKHVLDEYPELWENYVSNNRP